MKKLVPAFLCVLFAISATAQTPAFPTAGDIYLGLKKLNVLGSVLYVAAHPDDENTRLLTYFAKDKLYRTGYLSLTRGDGGQNLIGEEQGVELGLIRTQELLAARRIDGAEQFFTRAFDFGYSKSPQETFTKWDREKILSDAVWVIRKFQPDAIVTRFPTTGEGGHGQHTASAIIAVEAFRAAADPKRFPEQLQYVKPWQAKRLLWNTFNFGSANTTGPDQFKIDVGGFNPVLGKSYGEIAAESRSQHKSQGFGVPRSRGEAFEYFKLLDGTAPSADLHEDINTNWSRVAGSEAIAADVNNLIASFDFMQPQKSVSGLLKLYNKLRQLSANGEPWAQQKQKEVKDLLLATSGLWLEAFTNQPSVAQGDSLLITVLLNNRLGLPVRLQKLSGGNDVVNINKAFDSVLAKNKNVVLTQRIKLASDAPITQPYWLQERMSEGYFNVKDFRIIGQPDVQPAATMNVALNIDGQAVVFENLPVRYKFNDQVRGELYQPLAVVPSVTFGNVAPVYLKSKSEAPAVVIQINSSKDILIPSPTLVSQVFTETAQPYPLLIGGFQLQKNAARTETISTATLAPKTYQLNLSPDYRDPGYSVRTIRYEHVPTITYFTPVLFSVKSLDLKTAGKKIGYIVGAGDKVPEALEKMGYDVTLLTQKELERNNLKQFDAIIAGVRAFNANDYMGAFYDKLMKYVQDGGNYIVQYSQNNNVRGKMGPYSFVLSNKRITDENAPVTFLKPEHPALNFPNKISQEDFSGWVQERSVYHADNWDNNYEAILGMADPGEAPHNGSLLVTKYGKGFFTYTGLAFFRELPAGVPGAYRLLANLIALNQIKGS